MKQARLLLIAMISCVLFCTQDVVISEGDIARPPIRHILDISISVTPARLVEPGDVTLMLAVVNASEFDAEDVTLTSKDGRYSEALGRIPAGDVQTQSHIYSVNEAELAAGKLEFTLTHKGIADDTTAVSYDMSADISRDEPAPDIEFTRQISSQKYAAGSEARITYRVKNTGNVPLTDVAITDVAGKYRAGTDRLECGEEAAFTNRVTVTGKTTSEASVTYSALPYSDKTATKKLENISINVSEPSVDVLFMTDCSQASRGDMVTGTGSVTVMGGCLSDVRVIDDYSGVIVAEAPFLGDGEVLPIEYTWSVRGPRDFKLKLNAIADNGSLIEEYSDTCSVEFAGEFSESNLSVSASAAAYELRHPGYMNITVSITNTGNSSARDISLTELTVGEIRTFAFIPAGEATTRTVPLAIEDDTDIEFVLTDAHGTELARSEKLAFTISRGGTDPDQPFADKGFHPFEWIKANFTGENGYIWVLSVCGALVVVLSTILTVSLSREYGKRRRERSKRKADAKSRRAVNK